MLPSNFLTFNTLKHAFHHLISNFLLFLSIPLISFIFLHLPQIQSHLQQNPYPTLLSSLFFILLASLYFKSKPRPVYLIDFNCFKPPVTCRVPFASFMEHSRLNYRDDPKSVEFQMRILERSGLGEETCLPTPIHYIPPLMGMGGARAEAELEIFSAVEGLMKKTGIRPRDIDILILNCSMFAPTPSLSAMVVNKYKMRSNIRSFNLSGMGCSAGMISIKLARDLLQSHKNSIAMVISVEIISPNYYRGNQRSMLLSNCLFRMGAAAILLSNRRKDSVRAKYRLLHVVRTHKGGDDKAYKCVFEEEDKEGKSGVSLSKDLMRIAGSALKSNITTIGPLVLPASEQILFLMVLLIGKLKIRISKWGMKPYIPDFKTAFEHFCIHAGGRAVIDELQKSLELSAEHVEASRMTLHRFGNTSSSSLWYELEYVETKGRMKKGDRVWQIAFGSGFKCNSAAWRCNRSIDVPKEGPWVDCVHRYPVEIADVLEL